MKDYHSRIIHGITGTPTTIINGLLYPMSGVELVAAVKAILASQSARQE